MVTLQADYIYKVKHLETLSFTMVVRFDILRLTAEYIALYSNETLANKGTQLQLF